MSQPKNPKTAKNTDPSGNGGGANKGRKRNRNRNKRRKIKPAQYWGDPQALPEPVEFGGIAADPTAVVSSLGRPPLPGQEAAATHFFTLVYERAANLAVALAAVGGTDDDSSTGDASPSA